VLNVLKSLLVATAALCRHSHECLRLSCIWKESASRNCRWIGSDQPDACSGTFNLSHRISIPWVPFAAVRG